jgi:sucrose-6-phosphate hydrolase SacC (GH32 family)
LLHRGLGNIRRFFHVAPAFRSWLLSVVLLLAFVPGATALVRFDFEQKFYRHPGRQVWDFSIIRPDSVYHIFYHSINELTPSAVHGDTIWQASSLDLKHWSSPTPILTVGQGPWDAGAIRAPDVFRDEANKRWGIAYTGCDASYNQSICLAYSTDLLQWTKAPENPTIQPDSSLYVWDKNGAWSNFRDPFIYRQDSRWHVLVTAQQDLGARRGVIYHATSEDLSGGTMWGHCS